MSNTIAHHLPADTQPYPGSDLHLLGDTPQFIRCAVVWNTPVPAETRTLVITVLQKMWLLILVGIHHYHESDSN